VAYGAIVVAVVVEVVAGTVVVVDGAVVVVEGATVVEVGAGTVVGETVVVVGGTVVVVVVDGATTVPFPQQLIEAFQCLHPPFEYRSHAATAVLAAGS
jgi:hypothetical protein